MNNVTLGADPEMFLYSPTSFKFISAIGKIGGSKLEPLFIDDYGHAIQEDNVAVEFNIPPVTTVDGFVKEIRHMTNYLDNIAKSYGCVLSYASHAFFDDVQLDDIKAKTFGCEPDINAWDMEEQTPPKLPGTWKNLRTCGGHIHIGWDNPQMPDQFELAKAMDVFVSLYHRVNEGNSSLRRKLYGKAGSFRLKPYGIEYRTPSNYWIKEDNQVAATGNLTMQAIDFIRKGNKIEPEDEGRIRFCIDNELAPPLLFQDIINLQEKYGVAK